MRDQFHFFTWAEDRDVDGMVAMMEYHDINGDSRVAAMFFNHALEAEKFFSWCNRIDAIRLDKVTLAGNRYVCADYGAIGLTAIWIAFGQYLKRNCDLNLKERVVLRDIIPSQLILILLLLSYWF